MKKIPKLKLGKTPPKLCVSEYFDHPFWKGGTNSTFTMINLNSTIASADHIKRCVFKTEANRMYCAELYDCKLRKTHVGCEAKCEQKIWERIIDKYECLDLISNFMDVYGARTMVVFSINNNDEFSSVSPRYRPV